MTEEKSNDILDLSVDPFSEDHEITMMESISLETDFDNLDDANEVTETSFVIKQPPEPAVKSLQTLSQFESSNSHENSKSNSKIKSQKYKYQKTAFWISLPIVIVIFLGILYVFQILLPKWSEPTQSSKQNLLVKQQQHLEKMPLDLFGPQDHNIKLSEIEVQRPDQNHTDTLPVFFIGSRNKINFSLINWQTPPNQELRFHIAVKIFDQYGKLIHSEPNYKSYAHLADAKNESLLIENELFVTATTPVGVYNIRFEVIDESSQKSQTLQTQFRVLSKN